MRSISVAQSEPVSRVRRLGWIWFLAGGAGLAALYLGLPGTPFNSGPVYNVFDVGPVIAILVAARVHKVARVPLLLIALGQAMFGAGDVLAYNYQNFFGTPLPFPSIADAFYLATYPPLIAGLLLLIRKRTRTHDRASLIDTFIVWTASSALIWTLLIAPYFHDPTLSLGTKLTSMAYPVMDLGVLACTIRFAFGSGRRGTPFYLLITGVVSLFLTDCIYGWLLLHGGYVTGGLLDGGWIAFYLLTAAAALHPQMPDLVKSVADTQFRLTRGRIVTMALASLAVPAVLVSQDLTGNASDVGLLGTGAGIIFLLVILRMLDLLKRHETALRRASVLADSGVDFVRARTQTGVTEAAITAATNIVGPHCQVSLAPPGQPVGSDSLAVELLGRDESRGALVVRPADACDGDMAEALRMLATEVAMALDGVILASRFRSLVQNASDVIIVVDSYGRVSYASPPALRVLTFDPSQLEGTELTSVVAESDRAIVAHAIRSQATSHTVQSLQFVVNTARGPVEVEAVCTNLLEDESVRGVVFTVRDISERKRFERQLAHQAFHDDLTGLANRALFRDRVEHALTRSQRSASPMTILFLDLDEFKTVNDTLGHAAGDELLRTIAGWISDVLRASDSAARLGGDEFAILIEDTDRAEATRISDRLIEVISAPIELENRQIRIAATIGIAEASLSHPVTADVLLRQADVAMYAAKETGRGCHRFFAEEMQTAIVDRLEMKDALEHALSRDELELHYQSIVDLETNEIVFVEALLQWGLVDPGKFISLAEETGLIIPIGAWVLEQAVAQAMRLIELVGPTAPAVAVNLSARQVQRPELVDEVKQLIASSGLPPEKLILEITETVMMNDLDSALVNLNLLKAHGVRIALDDFGSGYSSLNYVRSLPVDILKVDRGFVANLTEPGQVASLTQMMVELGSILGMTPIAEGIENREQLLSLQKLGCPLGQGFLFMKPINASGIEKAVVEQFESGWANGAAAEAA